jgi:hypothetical protein
MVYILTSKAIIAKTGYKNQRCYTYCMSALDKGSYYLRILFLENGIKHRQKYLKICNVSQICSERVVA